MGRSVSYPSNSLVAFTTIDYDFDWDMFIDDIVCTAKTLYPSLDYCDKWLDREDHVLLENRLVYFGVSEYDGLVSIWMVAKDFESDYSYEESMRNLADNWINLIENKFSRTFGTLRKLGNFSNGESVFEKIN